MSRNQTYTLCDNTNAIDCPPLFPPPGVLGAGRCGEAAAVIDAGIARGGGGRSTLPLPSRLFPGPLLLFPFPRASPPSLLRLLSALHHVSPLPSPETHPCPAGRGRQPKWLRQKAMAMTYALGVLGANYYKAYFRHSVASSPQAIIVSFGKFPRLSTAAMAHMDGSPSPAAGTDIDDSPSPVAGTAEPETEHPGAADAPAAGRGEAWLAAATTAFPRSPEADCPNVELPGLGDIVVFNDPDNADWRVFDNLPGRRAPATEFIHRLQPCRTS